MSRSSIDSLTHKRTAPFIVEICISIITAVSLFKDDNISIKYVLAFLVGLYYILNYIFDVSTVPIDYTDSEIGDLKSLSIWRMLSTFDRKYKYSNDNDIPFNNEKMIDINTMRTLYHERKNIKIHNERKLIVTIYFCDFKNCESHWNIFIMWICMVVYLLGITRKNFTNLSYDNIVEHIDEKMISGDGKYYGLWILLEYDHNNFVNSLSNIVESNEFTETLRKFIDCIMEQNKLLKEKTIVPESENCLSINNKLLLELTGKTTEISLPLSSNIILYSSILSLIKEKEEIIKNYKESMYNNVSSGNALCKPPWTSPIRNDANIYAIAPPKK